MAIKDWFKKKETIEEEYSPFIYVDEIDLAANQAKKISANFKGEIEQKIKTFPTDLGEEHPFDFSQCEGIYTKMGFVTGVIDKFIDFVVGPGFYIECDNERAKKIIDDFMRDVNMDTLLRAWIKEALVKGNGFLEIGGKKGEVPKGLKVLNANWMYVKRDKFGVVEEYNQYTGGFKRFDKTKAIPFNPYQIAHIPFNKVGDCAYGLGIVSPALVTIDHLLQQEKDLHMLMNRKANAPYDVTMGKVVSGKYIKPRKEDIISFGKKLETLHNKHEWVHDGLTEIKVLDFGNIGEKFEAVLNYDTDMLFFTFQVPEVLMGRGKIPEGLAKVQMDAFERRIQSIQAEVEKVIENDLFKRILLANGFDVHVEFQWGRPSSMEKNERLKRIWEMLKVPTISAPLVKLMEKDVVKLLDYDEKEYEMMSEEEEKKRELERPQPIVPGQQAEPPAPVPKEKPVPPVPTEIFENYLSRFNKIEEWLGFNYKKYLKSIKDVVKKDKFELLLAKTKIEEVAGKFTPTQVTALKGVLDEGFTKGQGIREMAHNIDTKVKPKDLLKMEAGKIVKDTAGVSVLQRSKEFRSISIARTEVTRLANEGAVAEYKKAGVERVVWVASWGPRTCDECAGLDGQVFPIDNYPTLPVHTNCRCAVVSVEEAR